VGQWKTYSRLLNQKITNYGVFITGDSVLHCDIHNKSDLDLTDLKSIIDKFIPFASKRMGFRSKPVVVFQSDPENSKEIFGRTAHFDPNTKTITIYVDNRHPKDMLRSMSHELVHQSQHERGEFDDLGAAVAGYAQNNPHLRNMEREAYEVGNMVFRDFEDVHKKYLAESKMYTGKKDYTNNEEFVKKVAEKEHEKKYQKLLKGFTKGKERKNG
jgi:hypothetical protein